MYVCVYAYLYIYISVYLYIYINYIYITTYLYSVGFPGGASGKESTYQSQGFHPWVGKSPWKRK